MVEYIDVDIVQRVFKDKDDAGSRRISSCGSWKFIQLGAEMLSAAEISYKQLGTNGLIHERFVSFVKPLLESKWLEMAALLFNYARMSLMK